MARLCRCCVVVVDDDDDDDVIVVVVVVVIVVGSVVVAFVGVLRFVTFQSLRYNVLYITTFTNA